MLAHVVSLYEQAQGPLLRIQRTNPDVSKRIKVLCKPDYQNWLLYLVDQNKSIEMVLTKSDEWEYENEFRLWTGAEDGQSPYLKPEGYFLALPEQALTGIIVGCNSDYDAIKAIVDVHMPDLPVKRIVGIPHHYRLTIDGE